MKAFFLLRGAPGSGKTTWCESNDITDYAVRSDAWKIKISGYKDDGNGHMVVSHDNLEYVWDCINNDLYERFKNGDAVIILDSCNRRTEEMERYIPWLDEFGYNGYIVDFYHTADEAECKRRNLARDPRRYCPEWAITRFFREADQYEIPAIYNVLTPDEALQLVLKGIDKPRA